MGRQNSRQSVGHLPKLIGALLIYFVGSWLVKWTYKITIRTLKKRKFAPALQTFLASIVRATLIGLLILTAISVLGVNITSFAALLAGLGLAVGSALNGSLGNFAGGIMILIFKPFRIGDLIEAQDHFGIVTAIGLIDTAILTSQNKTIHMPNGSLSTGVIINYTNQETLRIDIKTPLQDKTDYEFARRIAVEAMSKHPNVLKDPAPDARITELTGDGPVLVLWPRIQVKAYDEKNPRQVQADYYSVFFGVRELVYKAFVENGIQTPDITHEVTIMPD